MSFNEPNYEISWDDGKTWVEGNRICGPGMLARVVTPGGKILWQGRGVTVKKPCGGCHGTGTADYYEFVEEPAPKAVSGD